MKSPNANVSWQWPVRTEDVNYGLSSPSSLLGRKPVTSLDSVLKSRDITLTTKVRIVKASFSTGHVGM